MCRRDTSRVIQSILKHGSPEQKAKVYEELDGKCPLQSRFLVGSRFIQFSGSTVPPTVKRFSPRVGPNRRLISD